MHQALKVLLPAILFSASLEAQTTYLPLNREDAHLYDRLETLSGHLSNDVFTTLNPLSRRDAVHFLENIKKEDLPPGSHRGTSGIGLSAIDDYNIDHAISVSGEWAANGDGAIDSKKAWFHTFYKKQPDFVHVKTNDFFLVVNPVIGLQASYEKDNPSGDNLLFWNSRGLELRGRIANRLGFYTSVTDNQEKVPSFVYNWTTMHQAVPNADYYQTPSKYKYDYLLATGYIDFEAIKDHINITLGYDKHFIGDGMRSLFLSDFASSGMPFLRINTKVWKLDYQNLYLELTPQYKRGADHELPHKYATIHQLSINATRWLNIGLFEAVVFDRADRYEFSYMIPIIFYRQIERSLGSPDNALVGLNFKAIAAHHFQIYGQLMLDEFKFKELTGGNGWWGNKYGIQLGAKYFNAFGLNNLDLQAELNVVRPYTYTHSDTIANYTHYNQPLAHPLGAGFEEVVAEARYQPVKNLFINLHGMFYMQGADSGMSNYGSNIFLSNETRNADYGVETVNGIKQTVMLMNLNVSYELKENLFIELGFTHRRYNYESNLFKDGSTTYAYGGLRLNIARRNYDFY